jgi:hypothetical protein
MAWRGSEAQAVPSAKALKLQLAVPHNTPRCSCTCSRGCNVRLAMVAPDTAIARPHAPIPTAAEMECSRGDGGRAHPAVRAGDAARAPRLGGPCQPRGAWGGNVANQPAEKAPSQLAQLPAFTAVATRVRLRLSPRQGFYEVHSGDDKSFKVSRLAPGMRYTFRMMVSVLYELPAGTVVHAPAGLRRTRAVAL